MEKDEQTIKVEGLGASQYNTIKVDLPSNSHKATNAKGDGTKKKGKIIKGKTVARKKSLGRRLSETFLGDTLSNVISYAMYEVLIPAAKSTVSDMVSGGVERLLFGSNNRDSRSRRDKGRSFTSYSSYYKQDNKRERDTSRNRARHDMDDIILETRGEAEEVLSQLVDMIEDYGMVTVADFYDLVGITGNFTDNKYGWENLSRADIRRVRDGYLIDLPRPILID